MRQKYEALGAISTHEISVLISFIILILLWFFRQPLFMPGKSWAVVHLTSRQLYLADMFIQCDQIGDLLDFVQFFIAFGNN